MNPKKPVIWSGSSKSDLRAFSPEVVDEIGYQLYLVQCGLEPHDWKPMQTVGLGVREIRVRDASGAYRAIYLASRPEAIYVLHCFQKKGRKTALHDVVVARQRLNELWRSR